MMLSDLLKGKEGEQKVISLLNRDWLRAWLNESKEDRLYYDIIASNGLAEFTIEVKNDLYAIRSGNIAIEFFNTKQAKPSGLTATRADLWIQIVGQEIWCANVENLRKFVTSTPPFKIISNGGDSNAALYLYKKDVIFADVFKRVDTSQDIVTTIMDILNEW